MTVGKYPGMSDLENSSLTSAAQSEDTQTHEPAARPQGAAQAADAIFTDRIRTALAENDILEARTLVANAEVTLMESAATPPSTAEVLTRANVAAAKARIAIATGDAAAARAILVQAIEANPDTANLRTLMKEVMLANGKASDVRPVLRHLGSPTAKAKPEVDQGVAPSPTADTFR